MPWSPQDAKKHNKGLSPASSVRWARIANSILARTGNEGQAIRGANARAKPSPEAIRRKLSNG